MSFWIVFSDKKRSLQTETPRFIKLVENGWDANALIHTNHHKSKCPTTNRNLVRWPQAWIDIYWTRTDLRRRKCPKLIQAVYKLRTSCVYPYVSYVSQSEIQWNSLSQDLTGQRQSSLSRNSWRSKTGSFQNVDTMLIQMLIQVGKFGPCKVL